MGIGGLLVSTCVDRSGEGVGGDDEGWKTYFRKLGLRSMIYSSDYPWVG